MLPGSIRSRGFTEQRAVPRMFCRCFNRNAIVIMMQLTCKSIQFAGSADTDKVVNVEGNPYNGRNEGQ